ncbi:PAS domain-containing protein [Ramlibacter terrae]|uniref:histidine kinase n=1 Tax=Ramlibacter terrae TaxID=2732511 RepID=A0ABX6P4N8_9BURK|nr:PAS domain-containing protein [Ramlibacter terrae]
MATFLLLVHALFPRALHARALHLLVAACAAGALLVALTPARVYSHTVYFGQALGLAIGIYVLGCIGRAARAGRRDAGVLLVGMAFLFAVLVVNLLEFYVGLALRTLTAFGLLAFVLSPALVLLRRLARALTTEEQRSTEQREKADLLVRTTQAGILDMDLARGLVRYSDRLLEILGFPAGTVTSDWPEFFERIHPHERAMVRETFHHHREDRSVRGGEQRHQPEEYRLLRQDGSAVWVHAEAISLRASDGAALRYICSILDITDHRAVAEGLKRQNAALAENARLREDVERMSRHDLKTPLNSIIGVTRLLREDAGVPPEHRELLAITERAGYRMLEMVNLSLDLSRMELGTYDFTPQAVNLVDVVSRVLLDVQGTAEAARVQIGMERAFSKPVYARAEELLCYSILANLVKNAVEATPAHGTVVIGIERGDPVRVWVHNAAQVAPEVAGRFFDKYATAGKAGGTGLARTRRA